MPVIFKILFALIWKRKKNNFEKNFEENFEKMTFKLRYATSIELTSNIGNGFFFSFF